MLTSISFLLPKNFTDFYFCSHVHHMTAANGKELVKYLRGEMSLSEGSVETAEALLVYDMPPYASLSPLQGQFLIHPPDLPVTAIASISPVPRRSLFSSSSSS